MQEVIKKIALAYERKKDQILSDTIYSLFHWHSPKQGYRTREEFESDKRYQELVNTRFLIENNKIDPENDIIIMPDGTLLMRFCWFYEKYFSEEIAILEKRKSSAQPSASNEAPDLQSRDLWSRLSQSRFRSRFSLKADDKRYVADMRKILLRRDWHRLRFLMMRSRHQCVDIRFLLRSMLQLHAAGDALKSGIISQKDTLLRKVKRNI